MDNNTSSAPESDQVSWAMASSYHHGLIARATRSIIQCNEIEDVATVIEGTFGELQLSGCARIINHNRNISFQFGSRIKGDYCIELNCLSECTGKITAQNNFAVFKEENIILVVLYRQGDMGRQNILQDSLAIFVDTVQSWLARHIEQSRAAMEQRAQRVSVADNINDIIHNLNKVNKHLMACHNHVVEGLNCDLVSKFPLLGLEDDQEESIVNIANDAMDRQKDLFEAQLQRNNELKRVMHKAIEALVLEPETKARGNIANDISGVELF